MTDQELKDFYFKIKNLIEQEERNQEEAIQEFDSEKSEFYSGKIAAFDEILELLPYRPRLIEKIIMELNNATIPMAFNDNMQYSEDSKPLSPCCNAPIKYYYKNEVNMCFNCTKCDREIDANGNLIT